MERVTCLWYCYTLLSITSTFLLASAAHHSALHTIKSDQDALLALKAHITLDPYDIISKNWSAGSSICDWTGVSCGKRHHRVTALHISNMGLTGTIVPHLGNLSFLNSINLAGNNFHGDLPYEIGHLSRLKTLNLTSNALTGEIPSSLGSLNQLQILSLAYNHLSGTIPKEISKLSSLRILWLYDNNLTGTIPKEISNLTDLQFLNLGKNILTGTIPKEISKLYSLRSLWLSDNHLTETIPNEICNLTDLQKFSLGYNNLTGTIPKEICKLSSLQVLELSNNLLTGTIPKEMNKLSSLQGLWLSENHLTGTIPKEIGNLTDLQYLDFTFNHLTGTIPKELGNLVNLEYLELGMNGLSGSIAAGIFNISTMSHLYLTGNHLSGSLPSTTGFRLPNLETLDLYLNRLSGVIPLFISNCSRLRRLNLSLNNFRGTIPHSLGNLRLLEWLSLDYNSLTMDPTSLELEFLTPLANCTHLTYLSFGNNPLNGIFPKSLGNLFKSILTIDGSNCGISSEIPASIGNLSNLISLDLTSNQLTGSLPPSIASLQKLQILGVNNNKISGSLPCSLFGLPSLFQLILSNNMFSGPIPECIGNGTFLKDLGLDANKFRSSIPMGLWTLKDLQMLNLSSNFLSNSLSVQVGNLKVIIQLDLSMNNLSGHIPDAIGSLQNLVHLSLAHNLLQGSIPDTFESMVSLESLDLSKNYLTGSIPKNLEKLRYLKVLNVSYNNLSGLIPSRGPFKNLTWESFMFNNDLCGDKMFHVPPCRAVSRKKLWVSRPKHMLVLCIGFVAFIAALSLVTIYLLCRRKNKVQRSEELLLLTSKDRISFYELQHATDGYNERNMLGQGSFGSVYKATLRDGRVVAVKVFNLLVEGALTSFDVECEMLRNLRHRNLTQVISSCSNLDFKAIVLEFMPNGSLENWLHFGNRFLSLKERLNIMIDVASALQYLHSGYPTPVVHADLKPSNVLLDEGMVAHLSDFGIAKMLEENSTTFTSTLATFGYIAPEYGSGGLVSTKCDVYSFGITLMEVFTKKKPNDEMFSESLTLPGWVNNYSMRSAVAEIIDDDVMIDDGVEEEHFALIMDCVTMIMKVALNCTNAFPRERSDIGEVVASLNKIKLKL